VSALIILLHHNGHHPYHPYSRSDRRYLLNEFKKAKPPILYGEMRKSRDVEASFFGMNKFLRTHDYLKT